MKPDNRALHWNYFLALEKDLESVSRYIEFCPDNFDTYSIELAHLLLSAASEVDTLAKGICSILDPKEKPDNINKYHSLIKSAEETETYPVVSLAGERPVLQEKHKERLSTLKVYVPRYALELVPWKSWAAPKNPDWWNAYNKVKHQRDQHFNKATLNNALHALAGLLALNYFYWRLEMTKGKPHNRYYCRGKNVTRYMKPESTFLRFGAGFYDSPIAELGGYGSAM